MKKFKSFIAMLFALAIILAMTACSSERNYTDDYQDEEENNKKSSLVSTEEQNDKETSHTINSVSPEVTPSVFEIDPFEGLTLNFFGISPFCTATLNNSKCSKEAQQYVKYSVNGEHFANGDTVIVTAKISENVHDKYTIKKGCENAEFTVKDMPYYVDSLDNIDTSFIEKELNDYIVSQISFDSTYEVFGINAWKFLDAYGDSANNWCDFFNVSYVKSNESHLITLKARNTDNFLSKDIEIYNSLRIIATCNAEASHQNSHDQWYGNGNIYVCFNIDNLIAYPDGSLGWGISSPESYEFTCASSLSGIENVRAVNVTAFSNDYNISVLNMKDWIDIKD